MKWLLLHMVLKNQRTRILIPMVQQKVRMKRSGNQHIIVTQGLLFQLIPRNLAQRGGNSTSSALTKLTNRLNFLKERRSQIANELQNMDKGRGSGQAVRSQEKGRGSEPQLLVENVDNYKGSDVQSVSHPEKGRDSDVGQSQQNLDRDGQQAIQSSDKFRKSNNQSQADEGRKTESQRPQHLDRGRSEGHVAYDADKSRGQSQIPSRTFSR